MLHKRYTEDPSFTMKPKYLSDEAMAEMFTSRPVTTSDVVMYQKPSSIFLTTRKFRPAEGLWVIGGARLAGETAVAAAVRKLEDETGLAVPTSRLHHIGVIEFIWPYRHQEPTSDGRHDINYVFSLEVTDDELKRAAANLDPEEYDAKAGLTEFTSLKELEAAGARENIKDYYRELFPKE